MPSGFPNIEEVTFNVISSEDIYRRAVTQCRAPFSQKQGINVLHPSLGPGSKFESCQTCGQNIAKCLGHCGVIPLEMPVFHIGFLPYTIRLLQVLCKSCGRLLLRPDQIRSYAHQLGNTRQLEFSQRKALLAQVYSLGRKTRVCPYCRTWNGRVSKAKGDVLRLLHEPYQKVGGAPFVTFRQHFERDFSEAARHNPQLSKHLRFVQQDLTPDVVLELFRQLPKQDRIALDLSKNAPEGLILQDVHVPPNVIRPTPPPTSSGFIRQDDLTMALNDIVGWSEELRKARLEGCTSHHFLDLWDLLQLHVAKYVDDRLPHFPAHVREKSAGCLLSLVSRLRGKTGRFRQTLSGKRVNFSGRSVISPDPNLDITQLGIPLSVGKLLTYPQRVFSQNIEVLREKIRRGPHTYPGANFVWLQARGEKRDLRSSPMDREALARNLREGDTVERHLVDGDVLLFNRQPSLHRLSMLAHRAKILPGRTFCFNECVCLPYNADFDGDEMNIHVPQTEEARAEALELMLPSQNTVSPRNGSPIIATMQDFLTASYILTQQTTFFDRTGFSQIITHMLEDEPQALRPPAICKPIELWTGKQVIDVLIRPNPWNYPNMDLNFEAKARFYSGSNQQMCPQEGYITIHHNELLSGCMDQYILGSGDQAKHNLFFALRQEMGSIYASRCLQRLCRLTSRWLMHRGFSLGLEDLTPSEDLKRATCQVIQEGYEETHKLLQLYHEKKFSPDPGWTLEETLENKLTKVLSEIRERCGRLCTASLDRSNPALLMAKCGSKGSILNISQMVACVGQQSIQEKRFDYRFRNQTASQFSGQHHEPEARGFVKNSFYSGLTPTEFMFHTIAGREGLEQSAVKTAQCGYLGRRLMKMLEDLVIQYDFTVRNAAGMVVQFRYGEDGLDPVQMETNHGAINFPFLWSNLRAQETPTSRHAVECSREELQAMMHATLDQASTFYPPCDVLFKAKIRYFCEEKRREGCREGSSEPSLSPHSGEEPEGGVGRKRKRSSGAKNIKQHLHVFLTSCSEKYASKICPPGTPCGIIAAQSLSEPTTQMTLRTFHFAGIAGMTVTQGVPRIEEITDARLKISTPFVKIALEHAQSEKVARGVKGKIECTLVKDVLRKIETVITPHEVYLRLTLCLDTISKLELHMTAEHIAQGLIHAPKRHGLRLSASHVHVVGHDTLHIKPVQTGREFLSSNLQHLRTQLREVRLCGLPTCARAIISDLSTGNEPPRYVVIAETDDLLPILGLNEVHSASTTCNHIHSIASVLGLEAARRKIIEEIRMVMNIYGLTIDLRHLMLLADAMTYKGLLLGTTNTGLTRDRDSVLKLASFERTQEHLFHAAVHNRMDRYMGMSESVILGIVPKVGTTLCSLLQQTSEPPSTPSPIAPSEATNPHEI